MDPSVQPAKAKGQLLLLYRKRVGNRGSHYPGCESKRYHRLPDLSLLGSPDGGQCRNPHSRHNPEQTILPRHGLGKFAAPSLFVISHWYFVTTGEVDLPSAIVCICAGMIIGACIAGVDVMVTRHTRTVLLLCLPPTMLLLVFLPPPPDIRSSRRIEVYDPFESAALGKVWKTSTIVPGAVQMQTNIVRAGSRAARIVLHSRDMFEAGIDGDSDSERAELLEAKKLTSIENRPYEYSFSMFIPTNFPIVPTRLLIAQWKQNCPDGANCSNDPPVLAVRYISSELRITQSIGKSSSLPENGRVSRPLARFQVSNSVCGERKGTNQSLVRR